jgi:hypothetical protein
MHHCLHAVHPQPFCSSSEFMRSSLTHRHTHTHTHLHTHTHRHTRTRTHTHAPRNIFNSDLEESVQLSSVISVRILGSQFSSVQFSSVALFVALQISVCSACHCFDDSVLMKLWFTSVLQCLGSSCVVLRWSCGRLQVVSSA